MRPLIEPIAPSRVLVTGGAGFLGAALCKRLAAGGAEVHVIDDLSSGRADRLEGVSGVRLHAVDVGRAEEVARVLFEEGPFEVAFHLAARVGVRVVLGDPEDTRRVNEDVAVGLIEALRMVPYGERPRLLAASSSEVYRDDLAALDETSPLRSELGIGRWAYAASKVRSERLLDSARELWPRGCGPVHLRFFNVVGPGQDAEAGFVLPRFIESARAGLPLNVHGDGDAVRTFAHVDEVAEVLSSLASHPAAPEGPLNVGGVAMASVMELADAVAAAAGVPLNISHVDPREELGAHFEEVQARVPSLDRLAALGCGVPSMGLSEIVSDAYEKHPNSLTVRDGEGSCASRAS